jgi:hypothetical protein
MMTPEQSELCAAAVAYRDRQTQPFDGRYRDAWARLDAAVDAFKAAGCPDGADLAEEIAVEGLRVGSK